MRVLGLHFADLPRLCDGANDQASLPVSQVDPDDLYSWLDTQKPLLAVIEQDLRDGKRRVSVAKGPRKRAAQADDTEPVQGSEASGSGEDD